MMFCPQCGFNAGNSNFCPSCGCAMYSASEVQKNNGFVQQGPTEREEAVRCLSIAIPIYQEAFELEKRLKIKKSSMGDLSIVLIGALIINCFIVLGQLFCSLVFHIKFYWVIPFVALIPILSVGIYKANKKHKQKMKKEAEEEEEEFARRVSCQELLYLPENYRYPIAAEYIYSCFMEGRAETLKEAINLYVEQYDRWMQLQATQRVASEINAVRAEVSALSDCFMIWAMISR